LRKPTTSTPTSSSTTDTNHSPNRPPRATNTTRTRVPSRPAAAARPPDRSSTTTMPLSTNQQYPHRIDRVRTSRDFGLSLRLSDTTTTPSSIRNNFAEPATRNARQNEIDQQKGSTRVEEEDEDDNDELLSFVAFGK
jgi:hypothetical protein